MQYLKIFCLCIFVGFFVIMNPTTLANGESHQDARVLFEKAVQAITDGEYAKSIEFFNKILKEDPSNIDVLINKGAALIELDRNEEAILNFDKILEIEPKNANALNNKGAALTKLEKYDEAIATFDQILEINHLDKSALQNRHIAFKGMDTISVKDSKYTAHVQIQVRNSDGTLISIIESDKVEYRPHVISDEFLEAYPIKEKFEINGISYETREIVISLNPETDYFVSSNKLFSEKFGYPIVVFFMLHDALAIEKGDTVEAVWTITVNKNLK